MNKKKVALLGGLAAAILLIGGAGWYFFGRDKSGKDENVVYVSSVEKLMSLGSGSGLSNRFSGVVEAQDTWSVQQNSEKTVKDVLVEVGQEVRVGEPLFNYDTDKYRTDLEQSQLDLERLNNEYSSMNETITQLQKDLKAAAADAKNDIRLQIQEAQLQYKQKEYEMKSKQVEIDKLNKNISEATVYSEIDGVVKSINNGTNPDMNSTDTSFMTILATGDFRIKGKINEMNMASLTEGAAVIVHSRTDSTKTWKGTVSKIDRENASSSNNTMGYSGMGGSDNSTNSSSYPFYVTLESSQDLMLGQHVYVEQDYGQEESVKKVGVWLQSYFINDLDSEPYVWADNGSGKLEKRKVTLGQQDEAMDMYEIADGLKKEDSITFPEEGLTEGMTTEVSSEGMMGQSNPPVNKDETMGEGEPMGEGDSMGEGEPMGESEPMTDEPADGAGTSDIQTGDAAVSGEGA
ncbi:MAG: efflux RND transporter periplasmic adaptor subunit [Lachnospiraceae bacterium]|nr:efflux RND transporter periplasmic adaptor subunit [Lachnospiraceae bacterium]